MGATGGTQGVFDDAARFRCRAVSVSLARGVDRRDGRGGGDGAGRADGGDLAAGGTPIYMVMRLVPLLLRAVPGGCGSARTQTRAVQESDRADRQANGDVAGGRRSCREQVNATPLLE